jgi:uncharacterized protein (TIGR02145 family)
MRVAAIVLSVACASAGAVSSTRHSAQDAIVSRPISASTLMPDGRYWTTNNLNVATDRSYCYDDAESNCRRYGRLYTWEAAQRGCRLLGDGWRLPTNDEWQQLAKHYGGVRDDSTDDGKAAYKALLFGGRSGLNAVLGGRRGRNGEYARIEAHGFYWTASASDASNAWFYNLGTGLQMLNRHRDGDKQMALSARCVRK